MRIDITGRQIEITPALREFAAEKLGKLEKLLEGPLEAHLVLMVEKHRHVAEVQVKSRSGVFSGTVETADLYASIGEVVDKLERQALKHKEKVTEKRRRDGAKPADLAAVIEAEANAGTRPPSADLPAQIIRSERYRLKPLSPEDAVLELEGSGDDILVYRDSESYRVNVIYRRRDGNFALIDPEF